MKEKNYYAKKSIWRNLDNECVADVTVSGQ